MIACCTTLNWLIDDAGKAGLSAVVRESPEGLLSICVQGRACDGDQDALFAKIPKEVQLPRPLRLADQACLKFCPFCGEDLNALVLKQPKAWKELAGAHRGYVLPSR